jgi:hypothetical protein
MLASFATYQGIKGGVNVVTCGDSYPPVSQLVSRRDQKALLQYFEEWAKEYNGCGTTFIVEDWLAQDLNKNTAVSAEEIKKAEAKAEKEKKARQKRGEAQDGDDEKLESAVQHALVIDIHPPFIRLAIRRH